MGTSLTYEQQLAQLPQDRIEMAVMMMTARTGAGGADGRPAEGRDSDGRGDS